MVPSARGVTEGSPKAKLVQSLKSAEAPPRDPISAAHTRWLISAPKLVSVGWTSASHTPTSPCLRWLRLHFFQGKAVLFYNSGGMTPAGEWQGWTPVAKVVSEK